MIIGQGDNMANEGLKPAAFKDITIGLITEGSVSEDKMPANALTESLDFHFDRLGSATLRKGTTLLGNALSGNILGLYEFRDSGSGTNNQVIAVNGTTAYYLSASTWVAKRSSLTASAKARFTTFLDYVWMVNGVDSTAVWDGNPATSFLTSGNASSAPIGAFIENYRSRVWIAGDPNYPDRLYFSSLPSSVTTPIVTWNTSVTTGNWIDISPSDGENITCIKRTMLSLLVFKNNHIYRVYSVSETEPDPKINVGTYSSESVVETKDGVYFHHPSGFFKYNYLRHGSVQELSKPIQDIVDNISAANYSKIQGWQDGDHIYWSVGNVTIRGTTFNNLVVRYTVSSKAWTHYSYPSQFLVGTSYNDGTTLFRICGDNAGNVLKINVGKTDNGTPIAYSLIHRWENLDGLLSTQKIISALLMAHDGGAGGNVSYQVSGDIVNDWTKGIGQLKQYDTGFKNFQIKSTKFRLRLSGQSVGEPFVYKGFEIPEPDNQPLNYS